MLNKSNKLLCAMLIIFSFVYSACGVSAEKIKKINNIIDQCGIDKQFSQLPQMFEQYLLMFKKGSIDEEIYNKLNRVLKENFTPKDFIDEVRNSFVKNYNDQYISEIENFYQTNLAKKMTMLEIENSNPDFISKISKIKIDSLKKERIRIIKDFLRATKSIEMSIVIYESTLDGFISSVNRLVPENQRISKETANKIKENNKSNAYSQQNVNLMIIWCYFTYEKASDDELKEYMKFYISKAGQWMNETIIGGIANGAKKCSEK